MATESFSLSTVLCFITGKNFPGPAEHVKLARHLSRMVLAHQVRLKPVVAVLREELCRQIPALSRFVDITVNEDTLDVIRKDAASEVGETLTIDSADVQMPRLAHS